MEREKKAQTPNGWCKRNSEKVKIHIFHLSGAAHTSIKCVIILVNLWRYSIVVVWHFFRSNKIIANTEILYQRRRKRTASIFDQQLNDDGITWKTEILKFSSILHSTKVVKKKPIHKINGFIEINVFHFDGF